MALDPTSITNSTVFIVRVLAKSGCRHSVTEIDGELKITNTYFNMIWLTKYGEIHTIAFKRAVYDNLDAFEKGKLYEVRKVKAKQVGNAYWHPKIQFQIVLTQFTQVTELSENIYTLPIPKLNFTKIKNIYNMKHGEVVDILAVVLRSNRLRYVDTPRGGNIPIKEVILLDQSCHCIRLTFWGIFALNFFHNENTVMLLRAARVRIYRQLPNISYSANTILEFNPDIAAAHNLRAWYHNVFAGEVFNISFDRQEYYQ